MNKVLVSYFSASGVTKNVAEKIKSMLNADIFEIEPVNPYTNADLDWTNKQSRSSIEMNDLTYRPEVKNKVSNMSEYDTVLIGFPVWWDLAPTIINTFIEENNLENKKVYVFATSGGSSVTGSFNALKNDYPNINFIDGKRLSSNIEKDEILNWIQ